MTVFDLVPGATYSIQSVDDKSKPWAGNAVYVGPEATGHYAEGVLQFTCEDGMTGMFSIEEVVALVPSTDEKRIAELERDVEVLRRFYIAGRDMHDTVSRFIERLDAKAPAYVTEGYIAQMRTDLTKWLRAQAP